MRLSSNTGLKGLPNSDVNANPRGFAIRFVLSKDSYIHFDIITNITPGFAVYTGEGFLVQFKGKLNNKIDEFFTQYPYIKYFAENYKSL
jgi:catalase